MFLFFLYWQFLLGLSNGCPCTFDDELGEVSCDPGSQSQLPWYLPECLTIGNDQVKSNLLKLLGNWAIGHWQSSKS